GQVVKHGLFWCLMPGMIAQSFIGTVIFFQAVHIGGLMDWSKIEMTTAYPAYAAVSIVVSLCAGWACDRFGPDRLLPLYLLPVGLGMLFVGPFEGLWAWWVALGLTGMSTGISHALWGALWPELYGTRNLGAIKATATTFMVIGSAIGPGITGLVIDFGIDFTGQTVAMMLSTVLISGLHLWVVMQLPPRTAEPQAAG
ncbi:MAG: MFS transporter, partial [Pseudomonadota bacterium]